MNERGEGVEGKRLCMRVCCGCLDFMVCSRADLMRPEFVCGCCQAAAMAWLIGEAERLSGKKASRWDL